FVLVPLRLRAAMILGLGVLGGLIATAWALQEHPVSHDNFALAARTSAGHKFGLVLIGLIAIQVFVGLAVATRIDRVRLAAATRRRAGSALIALVAAVGIAGLGAVIATGNVSQIWNQLTSPNSGGVGNSPSRLLETSSSRGRYWN